MKTIELLALSGSLRKASYNSAAIKALKILSPPNIKITIGAINELPLFNPDREDEHIPALATLSTAIKNSRGLIIASPEYAHGISGPMKNALDWLVGSTDFPNKPIMLINTSPRASYAQQNLKEVLTTMSGNIVEASCLSIPLLGTELDALSIANNKAMANKLLASLQTFCMAIEKLKL